jgi:predicted kinase
MHALIILRGLPGAGKSTLAALLSEDSRWPIFCIDDYFTHPITKSYNFVFSENYLAYQQCQVNTEQAMQQKIKKIIVDNAFTLSWEMEPYFKLANTHNYQIFVATVENYHGGKNQHGILESDIEKMAAKYKVKLL